MKMFSRVSREWKEGVFGAKEFEINVLVVADGNINFFEFGNLSLFLFCKILEKSALPWEKITVVTAHRKRRSDETTGAQIDKFRFDTDVIGGPRFSIENYDQVWLFGWDREDQKLELSEVKAIKEFMNKGGGVFATGDHEDLGSGLCGDIPRVRKMRRWRFHNVPPDVRAPSRTDSTRIDTLREGIEPGFDRADEEDAFPQEIRPKFFVNDTRTTAEPHELLAKGMFAITVLPDHMHEGECVRPEEIRKRYSSDKEIRDDFPVRPKRPPVWPQVVAIASSAAGTFVPSSRIFPVDPRCYVVISAYDGHLVEHKGNKLGRVVVDASFHHFVETNIRGFIDEKGPKPEFDLFAQYYRNTLRYLLPPKTQRDYFLHLLRALRYRMPLLEDLDGLSPDRWEDVVYAGMVTKKVISETLSSAHARRCALALIPDLKPNLRTYIEDMIDLWQPKDQAEYTLFFLNSDAVLIVILGHAILELASKLPSNHFEVRNTIKNLEARRSRSFETLVAENLQQRLTQLQERIGRFGKHLEEIWKIS